MFPSYEYILIAALLVSLGWHGGRLCNWMVEWCIQWIFNIEIDSGEGEDE